MRLKSVIDDRIYDLSQQKSPYEEDEDEEADTVFGSPVTGIAFEYFDERAYIQSGGLKPGEDVYGRNKFNQAASDELASNRDVPDTRNSECRARPWRTDLPPTSIIITFHNEARSTLLRTVVR